MAKKKTEEQATGRECKFCLQTVPVSEWNNHLFSQHGLTEAMYDDFQPGQLRPRVVDIGRFERVPPPPPPPPPPPEPQVEIRLADVETNPRSVIVEMRRGSVREFKRGQWVKVAALDAAVLLPDETFPGKYSHLLFERMERQRG